MPVLIQTLAGHPGIALWAAKQVNTWVLAVASCPSAKDFPILAGAHRAAVLFQSPDLPVALQPVIVGAIAGAGRSRRAETVKATFKVHAGRIVPAGVRP